MRSSERGTTTGGSATWSSKLAEKVKPAPGGSGLLGRYCRGRLAALGSSESRAEPVHAVSSTAVLIHAAAASSTVVDDDVPSSTLIQGMVVLTGLPLAAATSTGTWNRKVNSELSRIGGSKTSR